MKRCGAQLGSISKGLAFFLQSWKKSSNQVVVLLSEGQRRFWVGTYGGKTSGFPGIPPHEEGQGLHSPCSPWTHPSPARVLGTPSLSLPAESILGQVSRQMGSHHLLPLQSDNYS